MMMIILEGTTQKVKDSRITRPSKPRYSLALASMDCVAAECKLQEGDAEEHCPNYPRKILELQRRKCGCGSPNITLGIAVVRFDS